MHNTYILYKTFCKEDDKIKTQLDFRIAFMKFLIPSRDPVNKTTGKNRKSVNKESNIIKNSDLHLMEAYKDNKYKRCKHCSANGIRKTTVYFCNKCRVSLCFYPCFKDWIHVPEDSSFSNFEFEII
ncbi:PiggyBac transposable element-derived protein 4 [Cucumispora dikerogammari]|nr:PiggyBac transposable element-derived protein 4 [Cucumispora dikerogammari]